MKRAIVLVAIYLLTFTHTEDPEYLSKRDDFDKRSSNSDLAGIDFINKQNDSRTKANEGQYEVNFPRSRLFFFGLIDSIIDLMFKNN